MSFGFKFNIGRKDPVALPGCSPNTIFDIKPDWLGWLFCSPKWDECQKTLR